MGEGVTLIDTSAWILVLRKGAPEALKRDVDRLIATDRAATAGPVILELLSGTKGQGEYKELEEELEALRYLDVNRGTWRRASRLAYSARRKGLTVPSLDILIMAIAVENDCFLLHADRHFDLLVENGLSLPPDRVRNLLDTPQSPSGRGL